MLSRVADSLYWMARYVERTDSILRILKINHLSAQDNRNDFTWKPVLRAYTALSDADISSIEYSGRKVMQYMLLDKDNSNSVLNMITLSRENARAVQDNVTKELWQSLNDYYHVVRDAKLVKLLQTDDPVTAIDLLIHQSMVYYGVTDTTMFRGEGLCFMNLGKYIERALGSSNLLDVKLSDIANDQEKEIDATYWKNFLLSISGYALYLKRYRSGFEDRYVIDQVLFNTDFPRSLLYCSNQLQRYFTRLKSDRNVEGFNQLDFIIGKLRSKLQYSNVESVMRSGLHPYLQDIIADLYTIGNKLNQHYFAYS
jgi:uncharacterized alpha-E superfamily protein